MRDISRREAMGTMLLAGAGLTLTSLINAEAQTPAAPKAFAGQHKPRPLPFDPTRLKGISEKLIKSHWENNYSGAVNALNVVEQRLVTTLARPRLYAMLLGIFATFALAVAAVGLFGLLSYSVALRSRDATALRTDDVEDRGPAHRR